MFVRLSLPARMVFRRFLFTFPVIGVSLAPRKWKVAKRVSSINSPRGIDHQQKLKSFASVVRCESSKTKHADERLAAQTQNRNGITIARRRARTLRYITFEIRYPWFVFCKKDINTKFIPHSRKSINSVLIIYLSLLFRFFFIFSRPPYDVMGAQTGWAYTH